MTPDIAHLAEIHAAAFDAGWDAEALRTLIERPGAVLEAEADGFALLQVAGDEAEVLTLAVRPSARRRGLARDLMTRASARAAGQGATRLFLEVAEDNHAARALYWKCGFEPAGLRRAYYARGGARPVDALVLRRALNTKGA